MQKAVNVKSNIYIILLLIILMPSCEDARSDNKKADLLEVIFNDTKSMTIDSILYLDKNNSNELVLDRFDKYIKFNDIESDSIVDLIFSKSEYENYKKQTSTSSLWNDEVKNINDFNLEWRNDTINKFLHISKPIYSVNGNYALVYLLNKGKKGIHFMPKINVYYKRKDSWKRVLVLPSRQFK